MWESKEKCNKWHFEKHSGRDKGLNDPLEENFKAYPYYSIVREAIQNSLDAVDNAQKPVSVKFDFINLNRKDFPNLITQLEEHINLTKKYWGNSQDVKKVEEMLNYLNRPENKDKIITLKISDYNTIGMEYEYDDPTATFNAFLHSEGNSAKRSASSGGSFGFGKAAYFNLSPLRTILVSTRNRNNDVIFEGATVLATHKKDGEKLTAYGFYNCKGKEPVTKEEEIPEFFKRHEAGTDIYILGLWDKKDKEKEMIKSVLNNFWLAIHDKKLIVEVGESKIDSETISEFIDDMYPNEYESGNPAEIARWNPKPYYKAVKNYGLNEKKYFLFEEKLKTTGSVKLYVYLNNGLPNRISFFRNPRMLVYKQTKNQLNGYVGVFICDDEKGNEILKKMENPEHNQWKPENYKIEGETSPKAKKVKKEISDFIIKKLKELAGTNQSDKLIIEGLEEYLYIPEDLIDNETTFDNHGKNENYSRGEIAESNSDNETPVLTTTITETVKIKPNIYKPQYIADKVEGKIKDPENPEQYIFEGDGENSGTGGNKPGHQEGNIIQKTISNEGNENAKKLVNIRYRVIASGGRHHIILYAQNPIQNAEIKIMVGADNGIEKEIEVIRASKGIIRRDKDGMSIITAVQINSPRDTLEIEFENNFPYSVKVETYELS